MAHRMARGASGGKIALFAAALLVALGAMLALVATAAAQDSGSGGSSDDGNAELARQCVQLGTLEYFQGLYFARAAGSDKDDSDKSLRNVPLSQRLSAEQRRCAQLYQNDKYPNLSWRLSEDCVQNRLYSLRWTGAEQTLDEVDFRQIEKVVDYRCTTTQVPSMTDGSALPDDLIPPGEPVTHVTVRFRVVAWIQWSGFDRDDPPNAPIGSVSPA